MTEWTEFLARLAAQDRRHVATAALWLDEVRPGWAQRIDEGVLDMTSFDHCILGQLFGVTAVWWQPWTWGAHRSGYGRAMDHLRRTEVDVYTPVFACASFQDAWIAAIADRRLSTTVAPQTAVAAVGLSDVPVLIDTAR